MSERLPNLLAVGMASAMLVTGCAENTSQPAPAQETTAVQGTPIQALTEVPKLPPNIGRIAGNTVEVWAMREKVSRVKTTSTTATGSVVNYEGASVIVTAGHAVVDMHTFCADNTIRYPHPFSPASQESVAARTTDRFVEGKDAAVLVPGAKDGDHWPFKPLELQEVAVAPHVGDTVFSLGFGGRPDYNPNPSSDDEKISQPVIIPGTVLGIKGNRVEILTGQGGYAPSGDTLVRQGDSGGPLVSSSGEYLGEVVEEIVKKDVDIKKEYNVAFPPHDSDHLYQIAVAEMIDKRTVGVLMSQIVECEG